MLASIDPQHKWFWAACGKHPVSSDFLRLGQAFPLAKGFGEWIENGYQSLLERRRPGFAPRSWRFWARGAGRDSLVCGLVKDSSDSLGRPHPLLIVGTGPLKQWVKRWDLLPCACERTWGRIEYISAQNPRDIRMFEQELASIKPPDPDWSESADRVGQMKERLEGSDNPIIRRSLTELQRESSQFFERPEHFVLLEGIPVDGQFPLICLWHSVFKLKAEHVPSAAFMGGTFDKLCLAFFQRPLVQGDFGRLWEIESCAEEAEEAS